MTNTKAELLIESLIQTLDAMHIAQLTAYTLQLPGLFFCREYRLLDNQAIILACKQRLQTQLEEKQISIEEIANLLENKDYFDEEEARLRVTPNTNN